MVRFVVTLVVALVATFTSGAQTPQCTANYQCSSDGSTVCLTGYCVARPCKADTDCPVGACFEGACKLLQCSAISPDCLQKPGSDIDWKEVKRKREEQIRKIVQEEVGKLPAPVDGADGKDGADGQDGQDGHNGRPGRDGRPGKDIPASAIKIGPLAGVGYRLMGDRISLLNVYAGVELKVYDFRTFVTVGTIFGDLLDDGVDLSRKIAGEVTWMLGYAQDAFGIYGGARWTQSGQDPAWSWDIRGISINARGVIRPLAFFEGTKRYASLLSFYAEGGAGPNITPGMSFKDASWVSMFEAGIFSEWLF